MHRVERVLAIVAALACFAFVAAGCGSSSDTTSSTAAADEATATAPVQTTPSTPAGEHGSKANSNSGGDGGSGPPEVDVESNEKGQNANGAPLGSDTSKAGDNSMKHGSKAERKEEAEIVAAIATSTPRLPIANSRRCAASWRRKSARGSRNRAKPALNCSRCWWR